MKKLGTLVFTQIQQSPLKVGERTERRYDPAPILRVPKMRLTCQGVFGITEAGAEIIDVHHVDHPQSRNRGNANGISINFLPHYDRMRDRFPLRSTGVIGDGIAGENLVIQPEPDFALDDIGSELMVEVAATGQHVKLEDVMVIPPCAEFSCYLAGETIGGAQLRETLEFLSDGTRGFYASMQLKHPAVVVQAGDALYAV